MPASPLVASTLNRSQIEAWEVTHLQTVAAHWTETAQTWEGQFTTIHNGMLRPGGTLWEGTAADAAADQTFGDLVAVRGAAHALHSAAVIARNGADGIAWAKRQVVTAITEAEDAGFTVGDDLTVTEKSQGWLRISESRKRQMQEFATEITSRAKTLVSVDNKVAGQITAALSALEGLSFPDKGKSSHEPTVQMVDNKFKQSPDPAPAPRPPGPNGEDIAKVLDQLPSDSRTNIKVVRSQADIDRLWEWMKQNGVDNPGRYGGTNGVSMDLPDGTSVGRRVAARSTGESALDVNVPGRGYIKVHINPDKGAEPKIPVPKAPVEAPKAPQAEPPQAPKPAPSQAGPAEPARPAPPVEAPKAAPAEPKPPIRGWGGPSAEPFGPQPVHPPGSIDHHFPILGVDDPGENPRDFEGH